MIGKITKKTAHHDVPKTVLAVLNKDDELVQLWNELTEIQRNEWACYVTTGAKPETHEKHLKRMMSDMKGGKKHHVAGQAVHIAARKPPSGLVKRNSYHKSTTLRNSCSAFQPKRF